MRNVTFFRGFSVAEGELSLVEILSNIQNGKYETQIQTIRKLRADGDQKKADALKKNLPGFTPSGTFVQGRKIESLALYSGCLILDYDGLTNEELVATKKKAVADKYTFAAFISPSGNGLKVIVSVDSSADLHREAFLQVSKYYEAVLHIKVDGSGKDVSRLCFVSYDPECYINPDSQSFHVVLDGLECSSQIIKDEKDKTVNKSGVSIASKWEILFRDCVSLTEQMEFYVEGNRNNFVHLLACNCNRIGMPQKIAEKLILDAYNTIDEDEAIPTITSAYDSNLDEHAKYAKSANFGSSGNQDSASQLIRDEQLLTLPYIPDHIVDQLPFILNAGASAFVNNRERDVFITGAIAVLGGCIVNVSGLYNGKEYWPNLYTLVIAPPASGKGALTFAKDLGRKQHDRVYQKSKLERKKYKEALKASTMPSDKEKPLSDDLQSREEPQIEIVFIPADISSARIVQHMSRNISGQCVIFETEADTIVKTFNHEWGTYSYLIRKAFHHEPISVSRKTDDLYVEMDNPRLSITLGGTMVQAKSLIKSVNDGLFSRFIFYAYKSDHIWFEVGEHINGKNLTSHFIELSDKVVDVIDFLQSNPKREFKLTSDQWDKLNQFGEQSLNYNVDFIGEELEGTSKRLSLILFRLAMIITALRAFDNQDTSSVLVCSDLDFEIALEMVQVYEQHAIFIYDLLPRTSSSVERTIDKLYKQLPLEFQRIEAVNIAFDRLGLKERGIDKYLNVLLNQGLLERTKNGSYRKLERSKDGLADGL